MRLRRVVKYCYERDLDYYKSGQFQFGTLEVYRKNEIEVQRLNDSTEGKKTFVPEAFPIPDREGWFTHDPIIHHGHGLNVVIADNKFTRPILSSLPSASEEQRVFGVGAFEFDFNASILCVTAGSYSEEHHTKMMHGGRNVDRSWYIGDPQLVCAVELNLSLIIAALQEACQPLEVFGDFVSYGKKRSYAPAGDICDLIGGSVDINIAYSAIFTKSRQFSVEEEYRFVLINNGSPFVPMGTGSTLFKSAGMQDSVIAFHSQPGT